MEDRVQFSEGALAEDQFVKYRVAHWYGQKPPVPGATLVPDGGYEVEIADLHAFVDDHGPIILKPDRLGYMIWVTDSTGKFSQK